MGGIRVSIDCLNGSRTLTEISSSILNNIYFQNITQVSINNQSSLSQIPFYLCSLPSTSIDLSNQSFTNLDSSTYPCLSNTTIRTINLAYNQITNVNLSIYNWILIDLTSNNLTQLPYTLLNFNQNSISSRQALQRQIQLPYNRLTQFDLFVYTYADTDINLQNNPFVQTNGYHNLKNSQRQSLISGPVSNHVSLPSGMRFLINDQTAQNYDTCTNPSVRSLIDILQYMTTNNVTIEIQCDCSSIYLKLYYSLSNSSAKLTNLFSCSSSSLSGLTQTQFESLTESNCLSNISLSSDALCQFTRLEVNH